MKSANVFGWYQHQNVGDESYRLSFPHLFPDVDFTFLDFGATPPADCDNVVLGGGDVLYTPNVTRLLSIPAKRHLIFSVSANPNCPFDLLRKVDQIFVRDNRSVQILETQGIPCTRTPDASVSLEPNCQNGLTWIKDQYQRNDRELYEKRVGVVFNAHLYRAEPDLLARDFLTLMRNIGSLSRLADNTPASFIFFPMCTRLYDDRVTNGMIAGKCKFWRKNFVVYERLSVQQTLDLIGTCDAVISMRLHSSIFSIASDTCLIDITHHDKSRGYLESVGLLDYSLSYWDLDYPKLQAMLSDMLANKDKYLARMREARDRQREELTASCGKLQFV